MKRLPVVYKKSFKSSIEEFPVFYEKTSQVFYETNLLHVFYKEDLTVFHEKTSQVFY